jgi:hypothetical protein
MTVLCALMAVIAFMGVLIGYFSNQYLQLSESELSAPKSILSLANTIIPLSSIVRLKLRTVRDQHFLEVHHQQGKLTIAAVNLPDMAAFNSICGRLADLLDPRA